MIGWKGNHIAHLNFTEHAKKSGSPFWDFHHASLHKCLLDRAVQLGSKVLVKSRVSDVKFGEAGGGVCTVLLHDGSGLSADLVVGADGINSAMRELLLKTKDIIKDPELRQFVTDPLVKNWMGPDAHAVNDVLNSGEQFNMVLLVRDGIPEGGAASIKGNPSVSLPANGNSTSVKNSRPGPNVQQHLYHLHDGPEQREGDAKMKTVPTPVGECLAWRDPEFGHWLLGYDVFRDVEAHWPNEV
ncbi:hypothetical protein B9Z19DRAFT_1131761 [Tuber borchii]|uniref:FAD-binding domain-containing protein n=1 Tax=Tuber borchii TaxID=42251 RepID=A0A2T6ZIB3_TUBBO|nr:hypothetical protein B9Z19DRAFT_1131761 [Tuber borchii]